ncbi:unnamed protein product [Rotaria magnacalcarata]|uniref:Cytochrome P450 n=1 Tax=Rotaria magnacalcarata TaxID=392030 RepID=A0A815BTS3_9BILA|nr:unnamed protein product [Rotaria magnacalcarata]
MIASTRRQFLIDYARLMLPLLILATVVVVLLAFYFKLKYFSLRGPIPGLPPHFLVGNLIQSGVLFSGTSFHHVYASFKDRFGDIFQVWLGPWRFIAVSDIDDVQHIFTHRNIYEQSDFIVQQISIILPNGLISLKGAKYKRHIALTLPLLRRAKIISHFDLIVDCTDKLLVKWRLSSAQHVHLDIVQQCQNLLLATFGLIAFDYDLETLDDDSVSSNNELTQALREFLRTFEGAVYMPGNMYSVYLKLSCRHRRAQATIERYLDRIVERELAESPESLAQRKRTCLIATLVASLQKDEKAEAMKSEGEQKGLSRSEVLDELVLFLIAGYETTSTALAWFIHLMSKHPRVQQKIKAELTSDGHEHGLSLARLDSLVYLDCVINEVLRFCPPFDGSSRTLTTDDCLPSSGVQLYKGDQVIVPFYTLARDSRHWSIDPELFYPERFLREDKNHNPYALIPFGSGHRQCIGQDLARFELKLIAARLLQQVTFVDGGPEVNAGGHLMGATIRPKHVGVTIEFA